MGKQENECLLEQQRNDIKLINKRKNYKNKIFKFNIRYFFLVQDAYCHMKEIIASSMEDPSQLQFHS